MEHTTHSHGALWLPEDYSGSWGVLGRLSAQDRSAFNGTDIRVLTTLITCFRARQKRGQGALYLYASRAYLGVQIRRSVRTVSRSLHKLQALGYIRRQPRAPLQCTPQSSLTYPGKRLYGLLRRVGAGILQRIRSGTKVAYNDRRRNTGGPSLREGAITVTSESPESAAAPPFRGSAADWQQTTEEKTPLSPVAAILSPPRFHFVEEEKDGVIMVRRVRIA